MRNFKEIGMNFISSIKIRHKILILSLVILIIPCILFAFSSTEYYQAIQIKNKKQIIENELDNAYQHVSNTVEICNMAMQTMLLNGRVEKFIDALVYDENLSPHELINFNNTEISSIERLVNTNPYIHSIRFYINAPVLELAPVIYRMERSHKEEPVFETQGSAWYFNEKDTISPIQKSSPSPLPLATLVTPYKNMKGLNIGDLEIATPMEALFPQMYQTTEEKGMYFVNSKGKIYYDQASEEKWILYSDEINRKWENENSIQLIEIQAEPIIVGYKPIKMLDGYLVIAHSMKVIQEQITTLRLVVAGIVLLLTGMITILINISTKVVFRNFYKVINAIQEIGQGNLDIELEDFGQGEMGELGSNVQKLAGDIKGLMAEQVSKGILVKDAQIKALQNQINAHFIYNVLESIKMMAEIKGMFDISDAVTHLGKLLRYSMRWHSPKVKVKEELEYVKNYMALLNLRYDYEVKLEESIPECILEQNIPKMCIQPLVENAMKHGIEDVAEDTSIYIKGKLLKDMFTIEVTDFGVGMNKQQVESLKNHTSNGIGLKNVEERIQMCFGKEYGLEVVSQEGCFTKVIMRIPYEDYIGGKNENITHCGR